MCRYNTQKKGSERRRAAGRQCNAGVTRVQNVGHAARFSVTHCLCQWMLLVHSAALALQSGLSNTRAQAL